MEAMIMEEFVSKDMDHFRSRFLGILSAKKEEVEEALDVLMERRRDYDQSDQGSDFIENFAEAERQRTVDTYYTLLERKNRELQKIEFLLRRVMKEEEFGFCEECGEKIPEERLLIIPEATLCVPCQREMEKLASRKKWLQTFHHTSLGGKGGFKWEGPEDSDDEGGSVIQTDMEGLSFTDLEEIEIDNMPLEKDEMQAPYHPPLANST